MHKRELCPGCSGRGVCWFCTGTGWRKIAINQTTLSEICGACSGRGTCPECGGLGYIIVEVDAEVPMEEQDVSAPAEATGTDFNSS